MRSSYWRELYDARRDWAFNAHETFLDGIHPSLKESIEQKGKQEKHVTAVLYGSTQVGKTTLILHMLGVKQDRLEAIAKVLCGGQEVANSATATALRYRNSYDHLWHVGGAGEPGLDDAAATERFKDLRKIVEAGRGVHTAETRDLLNVYLPSTCFGDTGAADVDIRLIDLPGLNADNESEREHVRALARRYVPYADLVILVGLADRLAFLKPSELQLEELKDWWSTPYRFRIVCTRGFAPSSIADWLRQPESEPSMEAVRKQLIPEFNTHDAQFPFDIKQFLYLIEIGESWRKMEAGDPYLFARAAPLADEFMCSLIESVKQAANPWFRLKSAWELPRTNRRRCQSDTWEWIRDHRQLRRRLAYSRERLLKSQKNVTYRKEKIDVLRVDLARVDGFIEEIRVSHALGKVPIRLASPPLPSGHTVEAMRKCAVKSIDTLAKYWEFFAGHLDKFFKGWPETIALPALGRPPCTVAIDELLAKLDEYRTDSYWLPNFLGGSWDKDLNLLRGARERTCAEYMQYANKCIQESLVAAREKLSNLLKCHERKLQVMGEIALKRKQSVEKAVTEWADAKGKLSNKWQVWQEAIKYGERFMAHMQSAVETEYRRRRDAIAKEHDPAKQFQQYLLLPIIEEEYIGMKKGVTS